jgi:hypothetical protein
MIIYMEPTLAFLFQNDQEEFKKIMTYGGTFKQIENGPKYFIQNEKLTTNEQENTVG